MSTEAQAQPSTAKPTGIQAKSHQKVFASSSPILQGSSSTSSSPSSPSLTTSPLSLSPGLPDPSSSSSSSSIPSVPSNSTSTSSSFIENVDASSASSKGPAKIIFCSDHVQPFSPMYFYVPSKGKPLISLTVSEDENMSFCYYKVPSAAYYYTPFAHTLPSAGVPKQQEETEAIANVSAEGKELQLIAAGKFKEANGWVPRELMFRTKMCSFFYHTGQCAKGDRCNFSHAFEPGMEVPPPPLPKPASNKFEHRSKPCKFFFIYGHCSKGEDCNFSHDPTIFLNKGSSKAQKENKLKRDSSAN